MSQLTPVEVRTMFLTSIGEERFAEFSKQIIYFLHKTWRKLHPQLAGTWNRFCDENDIGEFQFKFICETTLWCLRHDQPVSFNRGPIQYRVASFQGESRQENIRLARLIKDAETNLFPFGFGVVNCPTCSDAAIEWLSSNSLQHRICEKPVGPTLLESLDPEY